MGQPRQPHKVSARLVVLLAITLAAAACSGNATPVGSGGSLPNGTTSQAPNGTAAGPAVKCDDPTPDAAVKQEFAGVSTNDLVCANNFAAMTVIGNAAFSGDGVVLLQGRDGSWKIVASGPVDTDPNELVSKDFSRTIYSSWRDKYDSRVHPTTTVRRPAGTGTRGTVKGPEVSRCYKQGDRTFCTAVSTTTTTTTPPTTLPTTTSSAPPTTLEPTTLPPPTRPTGPSDFCKGNPFDARCLANPSFPG